MTRRHLAWILVLTGAACSRAEPDARPRNLLLITIDTLRADRVGAYGYTRARTPTLDALARRGARFEHAYAAAPITLPSHATILTGKYPPDHGARDNGMRVAAATPTLATELKTHGFRTGAFVAAFPLDHQFGLERGFDVYSDRLPRDTAGRQSNERPAAEVVTEAIAWLGLSHQPSGISHQPFFLWVHLFEPHAPYGDNPSRPVDERYDEEVATADREIGRLLDALGSMAGETLVVAAGDHGEAFGEHGEYAHSIFVYDTTLRVPFIISGAGVRGAAQASGLVVPTAVTLADLAPTAMERLGFTMPAVDGVDLSRLLAGGSLPARELYAESFAPLVEFGWAPLRSVRSGSWKYVAAPKPELYDLARDAAESSNVLASQPDTASRLSARADRFAPANLEPGTPASQDAARRLRALGYLAGAGTTTAPARGAVDPKDRRELAARIAQVTSGELSGAALVGALEGIVRDDPNNGQAHLRLGYARMASGDCARAIPEFHAATRSGLETADTYLGLASCLGAGRDLAGAERALNEARRLEPDNPVVTANIGILKSSRGDFTGAVESLTAALAADPNLHEARFNLALAYARAGRPSEAAAAARALLARLPPTAPQRAEVERLLKTVEGR